MSGTSEQWKETVSRPFVPAPSSGNGLDVDAMIRIATAAEYIAAQMGEINRKLDRLIEASGTESPPSRP